VNASKPKTVNEISRNEKPISYIVHYILLVRCVDFKDNKIIKTARGMRINDRFKY